MALDSGGGAELAVRGDVPIRRALRCLIAERPPGVVVVDEFWLPSNERADIVAVSGDSLEAFEIKSAADDLRRLGRQVEAYSRIFDRCSAVVADHHLKNVEVNIPAWWGLIGVDVGMCLSAVRVPEDNPEGIDVEALVRLLWKQEAAAALGRAGVLRGPQLKAWKAKSRTWMWHQLLEVLDVDDLRACVRRALRERPRAGVVAQAIVSPVSSPLRIG